MSRYILTQEHLDRLEDEVQQLPQLNEVKQGRIKELELRAVRTPTTDKDYSKATPEELRKEINDFIRSNERQSAEMQAQPSSVKQLQMLLEEERKLREYSEAFAKQASLRWAEESLLRELTSELCELQRAEIEIDNKRIQELQEKLEKLTKEAENSKRDTQGKLQQISTHEKENVTKNKQLSLIAEQLRSHLNDMHNEIKKNPVNTKEDNQQIKEVEKWIKELDLIVKDINDTENLRKELKCMRNEIENKRRTLFKHQN